jgi:dCMP deaminase
MERISKRKYYLNIARAVSKRSSCLKRRYGCIIVKNDEIIATGYNGSPRGVENCCDKGKCPRFSKPHNSGDYSDCPSVHAEQNAMLSASRKDMIGATMYLAGDEINSSDPSNSYPCWIQLVKCEPCPICARMILNAGISEVVTLYDTYTRDDIAKRLI